MFVYILQCIDNYSIKASAMKKTTNLSSRVHVSCRQWVLHIHGSALAEEQTKGHRPKRSLAILNTLLQLAPNFLHHPGTKFYTPDLCKKKTKHRAERDGEKEEKQNFGGFCLAGFF